ncbi:MAG TPA: hypothetical protein ENN41_11125 [Sediminispirochaeta sp.]|nr:hypothetical protein [Sediminispirochaeta sp.]
MQHHLRKFDKRLRALFDEVDDYLEDKYGDRYPLHPRRAKRGSTSSKAHDGLFNVGAAFSAGYGSEHGRGYVIDVDMVTLAKVPDDVEEMIEDDAVEFVRKKLPEYFPERDLSVRRDGRTFKISGDLSLGRL